ncbi:HIT family protein [Microbacterium paraoxydans]|uniref:HIT family protein n=1 Tax=Microbacterium paraoxydans TaxID=199592 RepID=UPI00349FC8DB
MGAYSRYPHPSQVRLARNQAHAGYCLVILREHVTDMGHLTTDQLRGFWDDAERAGRAIDSVYSPRKIDYLVMGHRMPHLHAHVFPQHSHDDPKRDVDIADGPVLPSADDLRGGVHALRRAWSAIATGPAER